MDWLKEWGHWASLIVTALAGWAGWSLSRKFVSTEHCGRCRDEIGKRLGGVETKVNTIPSAVDIGLFALELEKLRGELKLLNATQEGLGELLIRAERQLNLLVEGHMRTERRDK